MVFGVGLTMRYAFLAFFAFSMTPSLAFAQSAADVVADFSECKLISKNKDRRKCFESTLQIYEKKFPSSSLADSGENAPNSLTAQTMIQSDAGATVPETFGFSAVEQERRALTGLDKGEQRQQKEARRKKEMLIATVAHIGQRADGRRLVVLENGQAWVGEKNGTLTDINEGDNIEIAKSRFGGFRLTSSKRSGFLRVRRLD